MKISHLRKKGFTLVEMTVAIFFGLVVASVGTMLLDQQVGIIRTVNQQNFILSDAPEINYTVSTILAKADAIRLHSDFTTAVNDSTPVTTGGQTLVAAFRNPDNTNSFGFISLDPPAAASGNPSLNYYILNPNGTGPTSTNPIQNMPAWTISRNVAAVDFALVNGLFQLTLTGPVGEVITYTIAPNQ